MVFTKSSQKSFGERTGKCMNDGVHDNDVGAHANIRAVVHLSLELCCAFCH